MDETTIIGFMAIFLAVLAIGLPYIPDSILPRIFLGNKHGEEEAIVVKRFLGVMAVGAYAGFLVLLGYLIVIYTSPIADIIIKNVKITAKWQMPIQLFFALLGVGIVVLIIRTAWNKAVISVRQNPLIQKENTKSVNNMIAPTESTVNTADIAKMNKEQLKAWTSYINYLKKKNGVK